MNVMIDVGASNGCYSKNYRGVVYAFEPNKKNLIELNKINRLNYFVIDRAVDIENGKKTFYEANYTNSSSLLPFTENVSKWINPPNVKDVLKTIRSYDVECIRLDTFLDYAKYDGPIDIVKVDTQGNDLRVIQSLGKYLKNVKTIIAEVQITDYALYESATRRSDLIDYMCDNGFRLDRIQAWSQNQEENLTFCRNV